jgi:ATP-dependent RNA helicase DeaD
MPFPPTHPALERALAEHGYTEPTPVQEAVLQAGAEARDLLVSAQTGSGKTVAYGLALAGTLLGGEPTFGAARAPLTLVVAPTRELALQVERELAWLYRPAGVRMASCIGGMDARREARALEFGCHIVVGTPGRLCDHLRRGALDLSDLRAVVLDEADEMLDLGFRDELEQLLAASPEGRRTLLFSATIAPEIASLARKFQQDALRIDTLVRDQPHADIEYRALRVAPHEAEHAVVNVLRYFEAPAALVFCSTREAVRHLHGSLLERGFTAVALSGELTQAERTRALQSLREGQARVCVATDVAARGLDLPDLGLVIHADLPIDHSTLLHRSGRTGRAGRKGTCILVVPANRYRRAEHLLSAAGVSATWGAAPSADEIRARDGARLLQDPLLNDEPSAEDAALARTLLEGRTAEEVAAALVRLHRSRLPAPEELSAFAGRAPRDTARAERSERPERAERPDRRPGERMTWFSLSIGRRNKADPKWLVPLICRLGNVTKPDIGTIRIGDRETVFGIREEVAPRFATAAGEGDGEVRIGLASAPPASAGKEPVRKRTPFGRPRGKVRAA